MSDDYHFTKDPATLIDARLTKEEASIVEVYRRAKEGGWDGRVPFVVVVPVSRQLLNERNELSEDIAIKAEQAAMEAVMGVVFAAGESPGEHQTPGPERTPDAS